MLMGLIKVPMDDLVIVMNSYAVQGAPKNAGFGLEPKRSAGSTMMLWQILIGNVLTWHLTSNLLPSNSMKLHFNYQFIIMKNN